MFFGTGDFSFFDQSLNLESKRQSETDQVIKLFLDRFEKSQNFSFQIFSLSQLELDFICFY